METMRLRVAANMPLSLEVCIVICMYLLSTPRTSHSFLLLILKVCPKLSYAQAYPLFEAKSWMESSTGLLLGTLVLEVILLQVTGLRHKLGLK